MMTSNLLEKDPGYMQFYHLYKINKLWLSKLPTVRRNNWVNLITEMRARDICTDESAHNFCKIFFKIVYFSVFESARQP